MHWVPGQTPAKDTAIDTHRVPYPKDDEVQAFQLNLESLTLPHASMALPSGHLRPQERVDREILTPGKFCLLLFVMKLQSSSLSPPFFFALTEKINAAGSR